MGELDIEIEVAREWNASFLPLRAAVALLSKQKSEDRVVRPRDVELEIFQRLRVARTATATPQAEPALESRLLRPPAGQGQGLVALVLP